MQGFQCDTAQFSRVEPWLRFNPTLCFFIVLWGLWQGSANIFYFAAALAVIGVVTPHAFGDWIYNYSFRFLTAGPALPPNPPPRRFACFVGMVWSIATGMLFASGSMGAAYFLGIIFLLVIIPMMTVHFCVASFIYRKVLG